MTNWWTGTRLVFERGLLEQLRSKTFKIVTALLILTSAASIFLPTLFLNRAQTYTVATVGPAPAYLVAALNGAGTAGDFTVKYVTRNSQKELQTAVRHDEATVGLGDGVLFVASKGAGTFPVVVAQAAVKLEQTEKLAQAGLSQADITALQSIQPPRQVIVGRVQDQGRAMVGFAVGLILYGAILFGGRAIAGAVALEKTSRISEVTLAVLRPSQVMVGTVLAVGSITLADVLILAVPPAVAIQTTDALGVPQVATGDLALGITWFLLGFALYAFLFAAAGALVDKVTEVDSAVLPITMALLAGYFVSIFLVTEDPQSFWGAVASIFPITAPIVMPIRWASGEVPVYQLILAMAATAAAAVALVWLASTIYRRALLMTGHRLHFREVLGARAAG
ncbi:MAG TPA: ABC transporter permease [Dermatophilaceae bacterium]|jgi:ABC-2 type transport system permease protein|nr:ABC transporter permease [Dermatophilaceae bacterium]